MGDNPQPNKLEIPAQTSLERRLLIDGDQPTAKPQIGPPPTSDLLNRLQTFLPQMETANAQLGDAEPIELDESIENPEEGGQPYVELDLACGIFDLKDPAAVAAAQKSLINTGEPNPLQNDSSDSSDTDDSSSGDDGDSGIESEEEGAGPSSKQKKATKKKTKVIEELS